MSTNNLVQFHQNLNANVHDLCVDVCQAELAHVLELRRQRDAIDERLKEAEQAIRSALEAGASVQPGILSARWAGPNKDFTAAMTRIERLMQERGATAPSQRGAHFVSALCVAWPDGHLEEVEARADGTLVWPPRGTAGFGYDPAFLPDGHDRTFGEMPSEEKHGLPPRGKGLSHRARTFVKLAEACLA